MSPVAGLECGGRCTYTCAARLGGPVWGSACFALTAPILAAVVATNCVEVCVCCHCKEGPKLVENGAAKCVSQEKLERVSASIFNHSTIGPNMTSELFRSLRYRNLSEFQEEPCHDCLITSLVASWFGIFCSIFTAPLACCPPGKDPCVQWGMGQLFWSGAGRALEVGVEGALTKRLIQGFVDQAPKSDSS